jgi:5-methylcytosine-specific restriction enzyme B
MLHFTEESIQQAIEKIENKPELLKGRESTNWDLTLGNNKRYPPILVLSEAHQILGGEPLTLASFGNSTDRAFKQLRDLGFSVLPKELYTSTNHTSMHTDSFNYKLFLQACSYSNLYINEKLGLRFISSLLTKPFVILTGLSGSGKTKLALAFAQWITNKHFKSPPKKTFTIGEEVKSSRVIYRVSACDDISVTFTQAESGTKAHFPYELINDWISTIQNNKFTIDTPPRMIRDEVEKVTKYSTQLNSFETHLKAAAFYLMQKIAPPVDQTPAICLVPVGADWTNRDPLLGFPSALEANRYMKPENGALQLIIDAKNNPNKPHFLILDEMNLSHVERYFADFLSAMESKEPIALHSGGEEIDGVPPSVVLPDNLFIIGTVNIDETTYMFSPKVLDRANVIEFRVDADEMESFLINGTNVNVDALAGRGVDMANSFLNIAKNKRLAAQNDNNITNDLISFFKELKKTGAEFGYRTASEIMRLCRSFCPKFMAHNAS